jgi:hypothetical protein
MARSTHSVIETCYHLDYWRHEMQSSSVLLA